MTVLPWDDPRQLAEQNLPQRLDALAELVKIGRNHEDHGGPSGFDKSLLDDSEALLRRAGERLRLSGNHTVSRWPAARAAGSPRCSTRWPGPPSRRRA